VSRSDLGSFAPEANSPGGSGVSARDARNLIPLTNFYRWFFGNGRRMYEVPQLATAMLTIAFAAVMLVAGQLFIENRSARLPAAPTAPMASVPWDKSSASLSR
jgi:hypothetical protein